MIGRSACAITEFRFHVTTDWVTVLASSDRSHVTIGWLSGATKRPLNCSLRHLDLSRDIRAAWQYNNPRYNAAGLFIERVIGQPYDAFIRSRLTDKLGMTVSFTLDELEASTDAASSYMMHEDERLPALLLPIRTIARGATNTCVADRAPWMRL